MTKSEDDVHLSMFCPKFSSFYSNVTLKIRSRPPKLYWFIVMSRYFNSCKFGLNPLTHSKDNVDLSILGLFFAIWPSNVTLKIRSRSPKFFKVFCHIHVLDSCKFG